MWGICCKQRRCIQPEIIDIIVKNSHLYISVGIEQLERHVIIFTNKYSSDNEKTMALSHKIKQAYENCSSLIV